MNEKLKYRLIGIMAAVIVILAAVLACMKIRSTYQAKLAAKEAAKAEQAAQLQEEENGAIPADSDVTIKETVSFTAVGDNLIHNQIYNEAAERADYDGYDFSYCYDSVSPFVKQHDINWINMETLITEHIGPYTFPRFATPGDNARWLYRLGWNVFSLASNHTYDHGDDGIWSTLDFWENEMPEDIVTTGLWTDDADIPMMTVKGRTFAFLSYIYAMNQDAEGYYGEVIHLDEWWRIADQIAIAKETADVVVAAAHWGEEYEHTITSSEREWAQMLADCGADIIIGTHPHVVQDYEWITAADGRKVFCIYSLGNFISLQDEADDLVGLMLECDFVFKEDAAGNERMDVENIHLIPLMTVYGEDYTGCYVEFLSDFTREEAAEHGAVKTDDTFSYDRIFEILNENVGKELLTYGRPEQ